MSPPPPPALARSRLDCFAYLYQCRLCPLKVLAELSETQAKPPAKERGVRAAPRPRPCTSRVSGAGASRGAKLATRTTRTDTRAKRPAAATTAAVGHHSSSRAEPAVAVAVGGVESRVVCGPRPLALTQARAVGLCRVRAVEKLGDLAVESFLQAARLTSRVAVADAWTGVPGQNQKTGEGMDSGEGGSSSQQQRHWLSLSSRRVRSLAPQDQGLFPSRC